LQLGIWVTGDRLAGHEHVSDSCLTVWVYPSVHSSPQLDRLVPYYHPLSLPRWASASASFICAPHTLSILWLRLPASYQFSLFPRGDATSYGRARLL